jgi:predicted metal-dependent phosphoesterase TrpH
MEKIISDLHLHSDYSDGIWKPKEIFENALQNGLKQISITDHNTIKGLKECLKLAKKFKIKYVKGVEIDAKKKIGGNLFSFHILAYDFEIDKMDIFLKEVREKNSLLFKELIKNLNAFIFKNKGKRINNYFTLKKNINLESIDYFNILKDEYLRKYKQCLTKKDVDNISKDKFLQPEIIVRYIKNNLIENPESITKAFPTTWKKMFFNDLNEVFNIMKDPKFFFSPEEVIRMIRKTKGVSILAHPFLDYPEFNFNDKKYLNFLESLINNGLGGFEIYFYSNDRHSLNLEKKMNKFVKEITLRNKLMNTYGSDCHGPSRGNPDKIFIGKFGSNQLINFGTSNNK